MADATSERLAPLEPGHAPGREDGIAQERRLRASRRQLSLLFAYSLVTWSTGNGLLPLLPKYATLLGADPTLIGIYLGLSYAAIGAGTVVAGWLTHRRGRLRRPMILVGLAVSPMLLVTSQITAFWQVIVLQAAIWWLAGMTLTFASILAGLLAGTGERGRVLGILAVAAPTGSIIGGLGIGPLADSLGFSRMWVALGLVYLLNPAIGAFVRDAAMPGKAVVVRPVRPEGTWNAAFFILLACGVLAAFGSFVGSLGRSLVMQGPFTSAELTSTVAVSGLATLPFPFIIGSLSDRLGRLRFLGLCYSAGIAGLVVYSGATFLWQFWLASALVAFVSYVSTGVGAALVVDLVDRPSIDRGLALFGATGWFGGVLGFLAGGYLFPQVGYPKGFLLGAVPLVATVLLLPPIALAIRRGRRRSDPMRAKVLSRKG